MTLIKLLVVIVIVCIIAAMLLPTSRRGVPQRRARTRVEISNILNAIQQYETTYGRWPVSTNVEHSSKGDFTFGTVGTKASTLVTNGGVAEANNSEIMSVIVDLKSFRNGKPSPNVDGMLNPRQIGFLSPKYSEGDKPGLGEDGVYRDPWGNPYIITVDLNNDGICQDSFYSQSGVSAVQDNADFNRSLVRHTNSLGKIIFLSTNRLMVWSFGPDGKADPNTKANQGVNKDNIFSWDNR